MLERKTKTPIVKEAESYNLEAILAKQPNYRTQKPTRWHELKPLWRGDTSSFTWPTREKPSVN
jgi:hypothetical protein